MTHITWSGLSAMVSWLPKLGGAFPEGLYLLLWPSLAGKEMGQVGIISSNTLYTPQLSKKASFPLRS